ncbi:hypothetical protein CRYUN_Cryun06bG0126200 [Craigia yunnanensis]
MEEMCGKAVSLRCQLPTEDLDALVSITSDEDLANLIEEYDRVASPPSSLKIRAFLSLPKSTKKPISSPSSSASSSSSKSSTSSTPRFSCIRQISGTPVAFPLCSEKSAGKSIPYYGYHVYHGNPSHIYLIHNGNHWQ